MPAPVQSPAVLYRCLSGVPEIAVYCVLCQPNRVPCDEFMGFDGTQWCPRCGWAVWAHD